MRYRKWSSLAAAAVVSASLAVAPPTAQANHGTVRVASHTAFVDGIGALHIAGTVVNDTSDRREFVRINAVFRNSSGTVVATDFTYSYLSELVPHGSSPFDLQVYPAPSYSTYSLSTSSGIATATTLAPLLIEEGTPYVDGIGYLHIPGVITNGSSSLTSEFTQIVATLRAGAVTLRTDFTYSDPTDLDPGASAPYEILISDPPDYSSIDLQADATTSGGGYLASWDNYFGDLGGTQFRPDVIEIARDGITGGCDVGRYCPADSVTREQMASFLARALALPSTTQDYFADDETSIHEVDINRVAEAGIATGCGGTSYCPKSVVTRAQMASFLARGLALPSTTADFFADDESSVHEVDINRVAAAGITSGCTATTYCPLSPVTRGQMAAFLHRATG